MRFPLIKLQGADVKEMASPTPSGVPIGPPFPFRVVKSLDPSFYRNSQYDLWIDSKKGVLSVSSACCVLLFCNFILTFQIGIKIMELSIALFRFNAASIIQYFAASKHMGNEHIY